MTEAGPRPLDAEAERFCVDFSRYPFLTPDLPGVGGLLRVEPRDFQVTELAQPATGEGDHLLVWVEKEDLTTRRVVEYLRDALGVSEADLGWAGLKDKRALTLQRISLPASFEEALSRLEPLPGMRVMGVERHHRKLQPGHLIGNRFRILLREPTGSADDARAILARLAAAGVPNYFGPQRFGKFGDNAARGYQLIKRGRVNKRRWLDQFLLGSLQSYVFNDWVRERMARGLYDRVVEGDMAVKHEGGGTFHVEDLAAEQPRAQAMAISASGPLFGKKYREAKGAARVIEDEVLAANGLGREDFVLLPGDRRALRVPLADWTLEEAPEGLWISFALPKGSFATAVLREVMKTELDGAAEGADE